jgi:hypothetical protein
MRELELLFGRSFPLDNVIDVRVHRARASGIAAIALGDEPTTLTLTLVDRTCLEARSRGRGPQQTAIETVIYALAQSRAAAALAAIRAGHTFAFGDVAVRPDGLLFAGKVTRWDDVAGYAIRHGALLWDDAKGDLAGEVRLAKIPFSDALVLVLRNRLPGRDYARMPPGEGPHGGVFALTARSRVPGTFRYQPHLVAVLFLLPVLVVVGLRAHKNLVRAMEREPSHVSVTASVHLPVDVPLATPTVSVAAPPAVTVPSAGPPPMPQAKAMAKKRARAKR